jgi:hypothetical protein
MVVYGAGKERIFVSIHVKEREWEKGEEGLGSGDLGENIHINVWFTVYYGRLWCGDRAS